MNHFDTMQIDGAILDMESVNRHYNRTSPRIGFGQGTVAHAELIHSLLPSQEKLALANHPRFYSMAGWMALELAAYGGNRSRVRGEFSNIAETYFKRAASFHDSEHVEKRFDAVRGQMGLIAVNAYQTNITTAIQDSAGMYVDILEDVVSDEGMRKADNAQRVGLISELFVGTVLSSLDLLALPASQRHDRNVSIERPSYAHDLNVWITPPLTMPAKPDRFIQVKSSSTNSKEYSSAITVLETDATFKGHMHRAVGAFIRHFNGKSVSPSGTNRITTAQLAIVDALLEQPGEDNYLFRGGAMRNYKTGKSIIVQPRKPIE